MGGSPVKTGVILLIVFVILSIGVGFVKGAIQQRKANKAVREEEVEARRMRQEQERANEEALKAKEEAKKKANEKKLERKQKLKEQRELEAKRPKRLDTTKIESTDDENPTQ